MFGDSMPSLKQLIRTALIPVGKTLYVWGGGWNQDDSGAGESSLSLGARCTWEIFFNLYGKEYDFEKTRLMRNMGLDCSGYIGWVLYNVFYGEQKRNGFVFKAKDTAFKLHEMNFGFYRPKEEITDFMAGDIMSGKSHVYMVLGSCSDGSVVILHSSPPGVQISGTYTPEGKVESMAVLIAERCVEEHFPIWYNKFGFSPRSEIYLKDYNQFRWSEELISDAEGYRQMNADEIIKDIFK